MVWVRGWGGRRYVKGITGAGCCGDKARRLGCGFVGREVWLWAWASPPGAVGVWGSRVWTGEWGPFHGFPGSSRAHWGSWGPERTHRVQGEEALESRELLP